MKERGILFSAPMVRALLADTKTQTRRIIAPQPDHLQRHEWRGEVLYDGEHRLWWWKQHSFENLIDQFAGQSDRAEFAKLCPYGVVGDRLWVRETWQVIRVYDGEVEEAPRIPKERGRWSVVYAATDSQADDHVDDRGFRWRPGIHMPRWASRILLDVVSIRIERLHEIDELGALAEGVEGSAVDGVLNGVPGKYIVGPARDEFASLWESINGERAGWKSNPWVWVVEFKRVVDANKAAA